MDNLSRLESADSLSNLSTEDKSKMNFNIAALIILGYMYDSVEKTLTCPNPNCLYSFGIFCPYLFEEHLTMGNTCFIAQKGGYLLNPVGLSNNLRLQPGIPPVEEVESASETVETTADDHDNVHDETLKMAPPKPTPNKIANAFALLNLHEDLEKFLLVEKREKSLSYFSSLHGSSIKVLASIGFYSQDGETIGCIFCQQIFLFTSFRHLIVTNSNYSPSCLNLEVISEKLETQPELRFICKLLVENLGSYGSKWNLGDEMSIICATSGFRFSSRNDSLRCPKCLLALNLDNVCETPNLADWHCTQKPSCVFSQNYLEVKTIAYRSEAENRREACSQPPVKVARIENVCNYFTLLEDILKTCSYWEKGSKNKKSKTKQLSDGGINYIYENIGLMAQLEPGNSFEDNDLGNNASGIVNEHRNSSPSTQPNNFADENEPQTSSSSRQHLQDSEPTIAYDERQPNDDFSTYLKSVSGWETRIENTRIGESNVNRKFLDCVLGRATLRERNLFKLTKTSDQLLRCSVCLDSVADRMFASCGHTATCLDCSVRVDVCPICRARITGVIRVNCELSND